MFLVRDLALMDSNNFVDNVGVGEREGRVFSNIVKQKYFSMAHGVGRSGDLTAEQVWKSMWISFSPSIPPLSFLFPSTLVVYPFLSSATHVVMLFPPYSLLYLPPVSDTLRVCVCVCVFVCVCMYVYVLYVCVCLYTCVKCVSE